MRVINWYLYEYTDCRITPPEYKMRLLTAHVVKPLHGHVMIDAEK